MLSRVEQIVSVRPVYKIHVSQMFVKSHIAMLFFHSMNRDTLLNTTRIHLTRWMIIKVYF